MSGSMAPTGQELRDYYESLRANVTGQRCLVTRSQGEEVVRRAGLPGWMVLWTQAVSPAAEARRPGPGVQRGQAACSPAGSDAELVTILTEMALSGRRKG